MIYHFGEPEKEQKTRVSTNLQESQQKHIRIITRKHLKF